MISILTLSFFSVGHSCSKDMTVPSLSLLLNSEQTKVKKMTPVVPVGKGTHIMVCQNAHSLITSGNYMTSIKNEGANNQQVKFLCYKNGGLCRPDPVSKEAPRPGWQFFRRVMHGVGIQGKDTSNQFIRKLTGKEGKEFRSQFFEVEVAKAVGNQVQVASNASKAVESLKKVEKAKLGLRESVAELEALKESVAGDDKLGEMFYHLDGTTAGRELLRVMESVKAWPSDLPLDYTYFKEVRSYCTCTNVVW